jgi:preprotein translocase subunit SecB
MDAQTQTQTKQNFSIINVYIKDASFESPNSPHMFNVEWKPKVDFDLQMASTSLGDNLFEAVLHLTVTTKLAIKDAGNSGANAAANDGSNGKDKDNPGNDDKTAFLVEVHQAGIFAIEGFNEQEIEQILATTAQEVLYPYAREFVSSAVAKGAYPQMLLPPVNFSALYEQHLKQKQPGSAEAANSTAAFVTA